MIPPPSPSSWIRLQLGSLHLFGATFPLWVAEKKLGITDPKILAFWRPPKSEKNINWLLVSTINIWKKHVPNHQPVQMLVSWIKDPLDESHGYVKTHCGIGFVGCYSWKHGSF